MMRKQSILISIAILLFSSLFTLPTYAVSIDELNKTVVFLRQRTQATEQKGGKVVEVWYRDPDKIELLSNFVFEHQAASFSRPSTNTAPL